MDMVTEDTLLIIRRNDFLAKLSEEEHDALNIEHNVVIADKNSYIYFTPQKCNKLYFIKEGYVKIGSVDDDGEEFLKDILQPGDLFGQFILDACGNNTMHSEFAQAYKADTTLCALAIHDFQKLLERRPDLAIQYSKKIGQKIKKVENRLMNLLQKDVRTRLLYFFSTLLQDKLMGADSLTIENFLTHGDIAHLTGCSRQSVTTLVNKFSEEGLLDIDRNTITIHNVKLLLKLTKQSDPIIA
ncbi:MAG: Crp/Fnr family transcriptional regulator [Sphingobacteriales bacterium]|nr:MAG: Crp/Fnr family transcriptional regulator [Sphingobacteriales bacterium]